MTHAPAPTRGSDGGAAGPPARVAVVIPVRNRPRTLRQALESLAAQTLTEWEAVVVDDSSTDDTPRCVEEFAARDPRVRLIRRTGGPHGAPTARNAGAAATNAPFLVFLDSDDLLAPHCLAQRVDRLDALPDLDLAVFPVQHFDRTPGDRPEYWNQFDGRDDLDRFIESDTPWPTNGPIWRRAAFERIGGWREGLACWQDWELHVRALALGVRCGKFPVLDAYYRVGGDDTISGDDERLDRLVTRGELLPVVRDLLHEAGALTRHRVDCLRGHCLYLAERCVRRHGAMREARRLLGLGVKAGLIGRVRAVEFAGLLSVRAAGIDGRRPNRYMHVRFPERFIVTASRTRGRAISPVAGGERAAAYDS